MIPSRRLASRIVAKPPEAETPPWSPATRLAFRFCFIYLGLFCLATQISGSMLPNLAFAYRGLGRLAPMRDVTHLVARSVFGITVPLDDLSDGEPLFFWVQTFWIAVVSVVAVAVWTVFDRRRPHHATLYRWFYLFVRLALAASLF